MSVIDKVVEKLKRLPAEQQEAVLEFVQTLESQPAAKPLVSSYGALRDGNLPELTLEDFLQVRREISGNFPREFLGENS